jgi:asparagine synthase (glutamine-hydrolysing)
MCGLFGFVNFQGPAQAYLDRGRNALNTLRHRGPNQWGDAVMDNVYCGHRRLSVLDVSEAGRQPMLSAEGDVAVTANGEIYNFASLRAELEKTCRFTSNSDTEVALHGYRTWGIDGLVDRIDGMYSVVIYDRAERRLSLIRDRVGIKPLYYGRVGQWFVWASELKAITNFLAGVSLTVDTTALYDLLTYRYIPAPKTPYVEIRKLMAGHYISLDVNSDKLVQHRYWSLPTSICEGTRDDLADRLRSTIEASVCSHLVSDVPVGTFLSGGMDSSIVSMHAARSVQGMHSFTIGFDNPEYDEAEFARVAATAFGTLHHEKRLIRSDSDKLIPWMSSTYDEPFGDYSALPTWHVSQLARSQVTVALSGDGGDELFGGYKWYERIARIIKGRGPLAGLIERSSLCIPYTKKPKNKWQSILNRAALYGGMGIFELYVVLMNAVPQKIRQQYRHSLNIPTDYDDYWLLRQYFRPELGLRRALQYLDFHTYLPDDILTKVDRASMATSLECRVPFLSRDVVEFAFSLPEHFLYLGGQLKGGLKYAYRDLLPDSILNRPKKGFGIPTVAWGLVGEGDQSFEQIVLKDYLVKIKKSA